MRHCHKCGTEWVSDKRVPGVKETCPNCTAYLHCCFNCRFHDRSAHNQCLIHLFYITVTFCHDLILSCNDPRTS
jgi:hypothetical protein